jgi:hypothetical protein
VLGASAKETARSEIVFRDPTKRCGKFDSNNANERKGRSSENDATLTGSHVDEGESREIQSQSFQYHKGSRPWRRIIGVRPYAIVNRIRSRSERINIMEEIGGPLAKLFYMPQKEALTVLNRVSML